MNHSCPEADHEAVQETGPFRRITAEVTNEKQDKGKHLRNPSQRGVPWKAMPNHSLKDTRNLRHMALQHQSWRKRPAWMIISCSPEKFDSTGELTPAWAGFALKCLSLAGIGTPDLLWTATVLARSVTK